MAGELLDVLVGSSVGLVESEPREVKRVPMLNTISLYLVKRVLSSRIYLRIAFYHLHPMCIFN